MNALRKRLLTLASMVLVAAGITAYAYFGTVKGLEKESKKKAEEEKIAAWKAADVKEVRLRGKGGDLVIAREGEGERTWRIKTSQAGQAVSTVGDKSAVDSLVNAFADMKRRRAFTAKDEDLKNFGLSPALAQIDFKTADKEYHFAVGKKNSFQDDVYLRRENEAEVLLVPSTAQTESERDLFALRDKRLAIFEDKDIQSIAVTVAPQRDEAAAKPAAAQKPVDKAPAVALAYTLEKKGEEWQLRSGSTNDKADKAQVNTLISAIRYLRAKGFAAESADDLVKYGLSQPHFTVALRLGDATLNLKFGVTKSDGAEKFYATQGGASPVLELSENLRKKFELKASDLLDKTVASFDRDQVKKLVLRDLSAATKGAALEVTLVKKNGTEKESVETWFTGGTDGKPVEDSKVSNLLYKLAGLKAKEIAFAKADEPNKKVAGLDHPAQEIKLYKENDELIDQVFFGSTKADQVYVMAGKAQRIDLVEKSQLGEIKYEAKDYEKAAPVAQELPKPTPTP